MDTLFPMERPIRPRSPLLRTLSDRGEGPYARPTVASVGSPEYDAYWEGFALGNAGLPRRSRDHVSDRVTRYYIDGFRLGASGRPTVLTRRDDDAATAFPDSTRTRSGHLLSDVINSSSTGFPQAPRRDRV